MVGHSSFRVPLAGLVVLALMGSGAGGASSGVRVERALPAVTAAATVPLNDCVIPDNRVPRLRALTMSPHRLDLRHGPKRLTVRADVFDVGGPGPASGVKRVFVFLENTKHSPRAGGRMLIELRPQPDGSWSGSNRFFPGRTPGRWVVDAVSVSDKAGLRKTFQHRTLTRLGIVPAFTVVGPIDRARPRLRSLHLSRTVLKLRPGHGGSVRVRAKVTDDVRVHDVAVYVDAGFPTPVTHEDPYIQLRRTASGSWVGRLHFSRWNVRGRYRLGSYIQDGVFHLSAYGGDDPSISDGPIPGPQTITVRGGKQDHSPPSITYTEAPASPVDLRIADQVVTVGVRIRDTGSGVSSAGVRFDETQPVFPLRRISGTRQDGLWQAQVRLSHCNPPHDNGFFVFADDVAGHRTFRDPALRLIISDHTPPQVTFNERRTGPLRFKWNEDVAGISVQTAPLIHNDDGGPVPAPLPRPVPGTWTCQAATGASVDCATGPVRVSTFTPAVKLTHDCYDVLFNPPGDMSVTDLAGNPADATGWCFE